MKRVGRSVKQTSTGLQRMGISEALKTYKSSKYDKIKVLLSSTNLSITAAENVKLVATHVCM